MPEVSEQQEPELKPKHYYQSPKWRWLAEAPPLVIVLILTVIMFVVFLGLPGDGVRLDRLFKTIVPQILIFGFFVIPMAVMMASGEIDLSMGSLAGLVGFVTALLSAENNLVMGLLASLAVALVIGLINGLLVGLARLKGVIVTFAMAFMLYGVLLLVSDGRTEPAPRVLVELELASSPLTVLIWLGLIGVGFILMKLTPLGAQLPPGESEKKSIVNHLLLRGLPYVFSSLIAWAGGILLLSRIGYATISGGMGFVEMALLAVLLGGTAYAAGTGFVLSAAVATIPVVLLQISFQVMNSPGALMRVVQGSLLIIVLLVAHLYHKGVDWLYNRQPKADSTEAAPEPPIDQEEDTGEAAAEDEDKEADTEDEEVDSEDEDTE